MHVTLMRSCGHIRAILGIYPCMSLAHILHHIVLVVILPCLPPSAFPCSLHEHVVIPIPVPAASILAASRFPNAP
ncbi:hypothetical protein BDN67DRAFT_465704 [Paxillus ammoniavirescens]|nr:hypothetical protein BDN67DRAFT_465704 [Paxillus ammoniavirescens]